MKRAFIFPGQGSQSVGMGKDLATAFGEAREVFEEVNDALSQNLSRLMFEGPEDELILTENAQPAIMAVSMAVMRVLERLGNTRTDAMAAMVAGHSMGEYAALCAASVFTVPDAARLLKRRGQAMQLATPVGKGAMAALLGLNLDAAQDVADAASQGEVCAVANDNAPGQIVISGDKLAVERAVALAAEKGARRCIFLPVSAPFHCSLMQPAADAMAAALALVDMTDPVVPLVSNVTAGEVTSVEDIRQLLVEQVTERVRWRESVLYMMDSEAETLVEIGSGRILTGMTRRIDRSLNGVTVGTPDEIDAFLKTL
ncbi:MAG: ACP S-malonyltransferase [Rhodospirillales bacterium]